MLGAFALVVAFCVGFFWARIGISTDAAGGEEKDFEVLTEVADEGGEDVGRPDCGEGLEAPVFVTMAVGRLVAGWGVTEELSGETGDGAEGKVAEVSIRPDLAVLGASIISAGVLTLSWLFDNVTLPPLLACIVLAGMRGEVVDNSRKSGIQEDACWCETGGLEVFGSWPVAAKAALLCRSAGSWRASEVSIARDVFGLVVVTFTGLSVVLLLSPRSCGCS